MFYDLHVHSSISIGENTLEEMIAVAKRLGLQGLGIVQYYPGEIIELPKIEGIDLVKCVMLKASDPNELSSLASKVRDKAEILMVHGGDYEINRAACENSLIDVLCHPELGRKDSGLDHICVKAANENKVALEINFREILESYKKNRVIVLSSMKKNIRLCRKYQTNLLTVSGAVTKWGLRSGRELAAVSNVLGLELGLAIDSTSTIAEDMVRKNREKLAGHRWEGVLVE